MRLATLLLAAALPAQTVTVENYGPTTFDGWHRCAVSPRPAASIGYLPDPSRPIAGGGPGVTTIARYVVGRQTGVDTWAIDVRTKLAPGQRRTLNLATFVPSVSPAPLLPADPLAFFGGRLAALSRARGACPVPLPVG